MEQAKQYLELFQKAETKQGRAAIIEQYQAFLKTLSDEDRNMARQFMKVHLQPSIDENLKELDALAEKANLILKDKLPIKATSSFI